MTIIWQCTVKMAESENVLISVSTLWFVTQSCLNLHVHSHTCTPCFAIFFFVNSICFNICYIFSATFFLSPSHLYLACKFSFMEKSFWTHLLNVQKTVFWHFHRAFKTCQSFQQKGKIKKILRYWIFTAWLKILNSLKSQIILLFYQLYKYLSFFSVVSIQPSYIEITT